MEDKILEFLKKYNLLNSDKTIVTGFSGGYDSMALLYALLRFKNLYNLKIAAAHLNHNWRGAHSDDDERNCREFCLKNNIEFYTEKLSDNVPKTETAAREERYNFFERAGKYFNSDVILTAHTKSDNAETILYRIAKGTGVSGICGVPDMRSCGKVNIFRPLMDTSREEIENYCKDNNLAPNDDESNFNTDFNRNYIRHEVLPKLLKINPKAEDAINSLSCIAETEQEIIEEYMQKICEKISNDGIVYTQKFMKLSNAVQTRFVYDFVKKFLTEYDGKKICEVLNFIKENSSSKSGKTLSLTKNLWLFCSLNEFYTISELNEICACEKEFSTQEKNIDFDGYVFEIKCLNKIPDKFPKEDELTAIASFCKNDDLVLRYRKNGDKIQPFGMKNTVKLKDFFINKGVPNHKKDKIVLLCTKNKDGSQSEILWAVGVGISEKLRAAADKNQQVYRIKLRRVKNDY